MWTKGYHDFDPQLLGWSRLEVISKQAWGPGWRRQDVPGMIYGAWLYIEGTRLTEHPSIVIYIMYVYNLYIYLYIYISYIYISTYLSINISIYLYIYISIYQYINISMYLHTYFPQLKQTSPGAAGGDEVPRCGQSQQDASGSHGPGDGKRTPWRCPGSEVHL